MRRYITATRGPSRPATFSRIECAANSAVPIVGHAWPPIPHSGGVSRLPLRQPQQVYRQGKVDIFGLTGSEGTGATNQVRAVSA